MRICLRILLPLFILSLTIGFGSCKLVDPAEDIPAYIRIDSVGLTTQPGVHGSNSHKISDAWVYVNDQLIGAFELPATIPVLHSGDVEVTIRAGIKMNGISATRLRYPFYNFYSVNVNLTPGQVTHVSPTVQYFSGITPFALIEDFENAGIAFTDTLMSDTTIVLVTAPLAFEGNKSAAVYLDVTHTNFLALTAGNFTPPTNGSPVFVEMNYKCNNRFSVGIRGGSSGVNDYRETIQINPSENWNKIYINVTSEVSRAPFYPNYKLYFAMVKEGGVANPQLFIDNIKFIY